jgi:hypothetical protein
VKPGVLMYLDNIPRQIVASSDHILANVHAVYGIDPSRFCDAVKVINKEPILVIKLIIAGAVRHIPLIPGILKQPGERRGLNRHVNRV